MEQNPLSNNRLLFPTPDKKWIENLDEEKDNFGIEWRSLGRRGGGIVCCDQILHLLQWLTMLAASDVLTHDCNPW